MSNTKVIDRGDSRRYFTQLPNIIDDMQLSVYAFRLYVHLKRVAGESGRCWQSTSTLAEACKMSAGRVSKAKQELEEAGLITIRKKKLETGGRPAHIISICDVWLDNVQRYAPAPEEQQSSQGELDNTGGSSQDELDHTGASSQDELDHTGASSRDELASSPGELKNNPVKKTPLKKNLKDIDDADASPTNGANPNPQAEMIGALFDVTSFTLDQFKADGKIRKRVSTVAVKLRKIEIEPDQVRQWYGRGGWWFDRDWRGKKGQRPSPEQVFETAEAAREELTAEPMTIMVDFDGVLEEREI